MSKIQNNIEECARIIKKFIKDPRRYNAVADLSITTGLKHEAVETSLLYLLTKHNGMVSVSRNGKMIFKFPNGFSNNKNKSNFLSIYSKIRKIFMITTNSIVTLYFICFSSIYFFFDNIFNKKTTHRYNAFIGHLSYWIALPFLILHTKYSGYAFIFNKKNYVYKNFHSYHKINNILFGEKTTFEQDYLSTRRKVIRSIQINRGYTNVYDIMKIVHIDRSEIRSILAQLIIDYNGEVFFDKDGVILYYFPEILLMSKSYFLTKRKVILPIWSNKIQIPSFVTTNVEFNIIAFSANSLSFFS